MRRLTLRIGMVCALTFAGLRGHTAVAQSTVPASGAESLASLPSGDHALSVLLGKMLPSDIYGVRDIYPYWSLHYAQKMAGFYPELSGTFINSNRVNFYTATVSFLSIEKIEDFVFIPDAGLDFHYFRGHTRTKRLRDSSSFGFHLGVSPLMQLTPNLALRVNFKWNFNPGWSLDVGAGLMASF